LALLALCWRTFSETRQAPAESAPVLVPVSVSAGGVRQVIADPGFCAWTALAAATYGGIFCFLLLSPMVYVDLFGLSPVLYGWIPAGGSLVYILGITWCRRLLSRHGPVRTVQLGASLSLLGPCIQIAGCVLAPASPFPLLLGHAVYALGHGLHQPCGQAGAVGGLPPQLAGRAVSCSGFAIMCVAFCAGQLAAQFVDPTMRHGAWPMVLPMALAGVVLVLIAFVWLPWLYRLRSAQRVQPRS
ncbi:MAG TPA: MFS transporter, partial [Delftia acidovorans]|nr:MFS transporter [Delftia acidovorans]